MRKLILQMQVSIDGYAAAGPDDEQKWVTWAWDEIKDQVLELSDRASTEVIGRKLAVDYIPYWYDTLNKPEDPMYEVAKRFAAKERVVFSKSFKKSEWQNTSIGNGDLVDEINKLKNQDGKDIIVYGGCSFVSSLIKENLVDEYNLFVNPVALGKGWRIFDEMENWQQMTLIKHIAYECGIMLLCYQPKK